jgi:NifU-like protein involved in Fe-S cluster formation
MKKSIYISFLFAFLAINTISSQSAIKGEGDVVKKEITLSSFDGIQLAIDAHVVLSQGKVQKVVLEGQQNIIDNIEKEIRGGSWSIEYDKRVKSAKPVTIYITLSKISDIAFSGSGSISTTGKFSGLNDLDIAMSGSGDIRMEVEADDVDLAMSGSGNVQLSGSGAALNVAISGSGDVEASSFNVSACAVAISGSGDIMVFVNGDLDVAISGSGDVKYKGDAKVESRISGSGDVRRM